MTSLPLGRAASAAACAVLLAAAPSVAQGSRCGPADDPTRAERPADAERGRRINAITDTLHEAFVSAARQQGIEEPTGLAVVELAGRGRVRSIRLVRGNVPEPWLLAVAGEHRPLIAGFPRGVRVIHVRLDPFELPEGGVIACQPALTNPELFQSAVSRLSHETLGELSRQMQQPILRMLVTRDGDVAHASLSRVSSAGRMDMDLVATAYQLRFSPATMGGVSLDVWVEQPINVIP